MQGWGVAMDTEHPPLDQGVFGPNRFTPEFMFQDVV